MDDNQVRADGTPAQAVGASRAEDRAMSNELKLMLEGLRSYQMTPEEFRQQAISFAYGNGHFEDPRVTYEGVARAADALERRADGAPAD